jgi:hypothetical protein
MAEEKDFFEKGFDAIVAEADRYLAEKKKKESQKDGKQR